MAAKFIRWRDFYAFHGIADGEMFFLAIATNSYQVLGQHWGRQDHSTLYRLDPLNEHLGDGFIS